MLSDLINKNRSYRRFYENQKIDEKTLLSLVELARISPSPRNQQALKFIVSHSNCNNDLIFETLAWAGALLDWNGPEIGERPSAYIIILGDNSIIDEKSKSYNETASGIAAQSILLGAVEKELGGCMIAAIKRHVLRKNLNIHEKFEILMVIALGKPKETVILDDMPDNGNYNYWRDENKNHHVPKRSLNEIIVNSDKL